MGNGSGSGNARKVPWRCSNDHILGMVVVNGRGVSLLELYRHAVDMKAESPREVEVMGVLHGTMMYISCDIPGCGCIHKWTEDRRVKPGGSYLAE